CWDARAFIAHYDEHALAFTAGADLETAALRHSLHSVDHNIEHCLFDQVSVNPHRQRLGAALKVNINVTLPGLGRGKHHHVIHQPAHVHLCEAKFHGPGKVNEGLHNPVKTPDFAANHIHVAACIWICFMQLLPQHFKMNNDGIDGI